MTGEISSDYGAVLDGTGRALGDLPPGDGGKPAVPSVDPRLTIAVDNTGAQTRRGRDKVHDAGERTSRYTKGLAGLQDEGARGVNGLGGLGGGSQMPAMPTVPQSGQPAPAPVAAAPAPAPAESSEPPSGVATIDPQLLAALVAASRERASSDAAHGVFPHTGATTPQRPQPLDVSQVSLEKYPGGPLSVQETAAVIDQALTINGVPENPELRAQWQELYQHMAEGESARNANAANNSDANATGMMMEDGAYANSSRGMWQCIPSTFAAYHMAGTSNSIYDPVASAAASMNYVMNTYHVSPDGEGLEAFAERHGVGTASYTGY